MRWLVRRGPWLAALSFGMLFGFVDAVLGQEPGSSENTDKNAEMNTAQENTKPESPVPQAGSAPVTTHHWPVQLLKDFAGDQKDLWTSPKNLQFTDATWLVPAGGITAGLIATDADYSTHISHNPTTMSNYNTASNAGIAALAGGAGALWVLSYKNHNPHWRETGLLSGEAALNSFVMIEAMKYSLDRKSVV